MTAKEFYELNKGKYFMYRECRVRVVGFDIDDDNSFPIMVAYKDGYWSFPYSIYEDVEYVVDESLINDEDMGEWVSIVSLIPIEEELNLCELLKGCEGMVFYSTIYGNVTITKVLSECIHFKANDSAKDTIDSLGKLMHEHPGECTLFPSRENRDWATFFNSNKIKEGTPIMTKWNSAAFWKLENYTKDNKSDFIVPVSDFDFTDFDSNKSKSIV